MSVIPAAQSYADRCCISCPASASTLKKAARRLATSARTTMPSRAAFAWLFEFCLLMIIWMRCFCEAALRARRPLLTQVVRWRLCRLLRGPVLHSDPSNCLSTRAFTDCESVLDKRAYLISCGRRTSKSRAAVIARSTAARFLFTGGFLCSELHLSASAAVSYLRTARCPTYG